MNEEAQQRKIRDEVLGRIRAGELTMRSRAYFIARLIGTAIVALIALFISAFVLSFIGFSIHESGEQFLLGFGRNGVYTFFVLFPWYSLALDIVLLLILEWLLQGFRIGYRVSLISIFLGVFAVSAFFAGLFYISPIHSILLDHADQKDLPIVGDWYENIRDTHADRGVYRGTVTGIEPQQILLTHDDHDHDADDGTWTVIPPVQGTPDLKLGDRVFVFGTSHGYIVNAIGIEKLSSEQ